MVLDYHHNHGHHHDDAHAASSFPMFGKKGDSTTTSSGGSDSTTAAVSEKKSSGGWFSRKPNPDKIAAENRLKCAECFRKKHIPKEYSAKKLSSFCESEKDVYGCIRKESIQAIADQCKVQCRPLNPQASESTMGDLIFAQLVFDRRPFVDFL
jgi:hypothetical protein